MEIAMRETETRVKWTDRDFTYGLTVISTKETGYKTWSKDMAKSDLLMVDATKENLKKEGLKELVLLNGLMEVGIKDYGRMEKNKDLELSINNLVKSCKECL